MRDKWENGAGFNGCDVPAAVKRTVEELSKINTLINNAAALLLMMDITGEDWDLIFETNSKGLRCIYDA